jgi:hypothetical protein
MVYFLLRHSPWLSSLALGLVLVAAGVYTLVRALDVRAEIRDELRDEQIVTSQDARIPRVLVQDAATAKAQADVIKEHTLGRWGPFSQLPRDDPRRAQFIDGVALRTALNLAVMGFGITDLLLGLGAILLVAGAATVALATPALYFLAGMVVRRPQAQG